MMNYTPESSSVCRSAVLFWRRLVIYFLSSSIKALANDNPDTARIEANVCQKPERSRKRDIFATLAVEIPAFFCALLRLFVRWYTAPRFEIDDYVMLLVTGIWVPFEVIGHIGNYSQS